MVRSSVTGLGLFLLFSFQGCGSSDSSAPAGGDGAGGSSTGGTSGVGGGAGTTGGSSAAGHVGTGGTAGAIGAGGHAGTTSAGGMTGTGGSAAGTAGAGGDAGGSSPGGSGGSAGAGGGEETGGAAGAGGGQESGGGAGAGGGGQGGAAGTGGGNTTCNVGAGGASTDLVLWLTGDQVVDDGSAHASAWCDLSGHGNDFAQASSAQRPLIAPDVLNGHPVLRFDATLLTKMTNAAFDAFQGDYSIVIVGYSTSINTDFFAATYAPGNDFGVLAEVETDSALRFLHRFPSGGVGGTNLHQGALSKTAAQVLVMTKAAVLSSFINGTSTGASSGPVTGAPSSPGVVDIGGHSAATENRYVTGDIAEVRVYSKALSDTERQGVETELKTKLGLSF